jgi:Zn-dependent protease
MGRSFMDIFIRAMAILPALTLHELAHAWTAWKFGDPTPKMQNRISLNPMNHLTPFGTLMILFGPIGWAKPVQVNPRNFRDPEKDFMLSTAAGPASNIAQGIIWCLVIRVCLGLELTLSPALAQFLVMCAMINFCLALFNLVPLGPLDGHRILRYFLPHHKKEAFEIFNRQYGMIVLIFLLIMSRPGSGGPLDLFIFRPAGWLVNTLTGSHIF